MNGQPVWLVSLSRTSLLTRKKILVPRWPESWKTEAFDLMRTIMKGAGDETQERIFRMNLTMCLHRALRPDEIERLPKRFFKGEPEGIAGAPVEVLWENTPGAPSTKPCANPTRMPLPETTDLLFGWIPVDCGACESCLARSAA